MTKIRTKPLTVLKCVGPKLVPFFKTVAIFFVLYGEDSRLESMFYCLIKCLPVFSLMIFVLLHGMNFTEAYSYSRKILAGLAFSALGDAFLVWKNQGYFMYGVMAFAAAQLMYALAFGLKPFKAYVGAICMALAGTCYMIFLPGLEGVMVYLGAVYATLIFVMVWRAVARVQLFDDLWTWTTMVSCMGAVSFVISDFTIVYDKFVAPVPYSHPIIMLTYYAAQLGIAMSVVDCQVDRLIQETS